MVFWRFYGVEKCENGLKWVKHIQFYTILHQYSEIIGIFSKILQDIAR